MGGCVILPVVLTLVFWNEHDYVKHEATADEVTKANVVQGCHPRDDMNGMLVYASCGVLSPDIAPDLPGFLQPFVQEFRGVQLTWTPEILQWVRSAREYCAENHDGTETCRTHYTYSREWRRGRVYTYDSSWDEKYDNMDTDLPPNLE